MGFRCTFTTFDHYDWPDWFRERWQNMVHVPERGPLSSRHEAKQYLTWEELEQDVRRAIDWNKELNRGAFVIVYLLECGAVFRAEVCRDGVVYSEPDEWWRVEQTRHHYCHGCGLTRGGNVP